MFGLRISIWVFLSLICFTMYDLAHARCNKSALYSIFVKHSRIFFVWR